MTETATRTAKAVTVPGPPMKLTGLWGEDKVFAGEGAELEILDSAYFPILTHERWVMHNNMWTFVPESGTVM